MEAVGIERGASHRKDSQSASQQAACSGQWRRRGVDDPSQQNWTGSLPAGQQAACGRRPMELVLGGAALDDTLTRHAIVQTTHKRAQLCKSPQSTTQQWEGAEIPAKGSRPLTS